MEVTCSFDAGIDWILFVHHLSHSPHRHIRQCEGILNLLLFFDVGGSDVMLCYINDNGLLSSRCELWH